MRERAYFPPCFNESAAHAGLKSSPKSFGLSTYMKDSNPKGTEKTSQASEKSTKGQKVKFLLISYFYQNREQT